MPRKPKFIHPLREVRRRLGLTQPQFAQRVGVSGSLIQAIENGKRKMSDDIAMRIFHATGIDPESIKRKTSRPALAMGADLNIVADPEQLWTDQIRIHPQQMWDVLDNLVFPLELAFCAAVRSKKPVAFSLGHHFLNWLQRAVNDHGLHHHLSAVLKELQVKEVGNRFLLGKQAKDQQFAWLRSGRPFLHPEMELESLGVPYKEITRLCQEITEMIDRNAKSSKAKRLWKQTVAVKLMFEIFGAEDSFCKEYQAALRLIHKKP